MFKTLFTDFGDDRLTGKVLDLVFSGVHKGTHIQALGRRILWIVLCTGALASASAYAQQVGIGRSELVRNDLSAPGRELIVVKVDFDVGVAFARHSHPGEEVAYVLEGTLEYKLDGRPPIILKAGEALFIPSGTNHSARNVGTGKASELATYIVEKGKPLVVLSQ